MVSLPTRAQRAAIEALESRRLLSAELLSDIEFGTGDATPENLVVCGEQIFFTASGALAGKELWRSDGSAAGTTLVKDIRPGASTSSPADLTAAGDLLFFTATDSIHGKELWRSDGTSAGTFMVADLTPGTGSTTFRRLTGGSGQVYFVTGASYSSYQLWVSDGTESGTHAIPLIDPGTGGALELSANEPYQVFNGYLYFRAVSSIGPGLWRTNGATTPATLFQGPIVYDALEFTVIGERMFYQTGTGTLTVTDGIAFTEVSTPGQFNSITEFTAVGDTLYFTCIPAGGFNEEIWKSDGTSAGTVKAAEFGPVTRNPHPIWLTNLNGKLLFVASTNATNDTLFTIDSNSTNVVELLNGAASRIYSLSAAGGKAFFTATFSSQNEPGVSDGTPTGTQMLLDLYPGATKSSAISSPIDFAGKAYFSALTPEYGRELWRSDGTAPGTQLVSDLQTKTNSSVPGEGTKSGGWIYFSAEAAVHGRELFRTDGVAVQKVVDLEPGPASASPGNLTDVNGTLYFTATQSGTVKLFRTDGSAAGTVVAIDTLSNYVNLTHVGGALHFMATPTGSTSYALYRFDGALNAFTQISAIPGTPEPVTLAKVAQVGGTLYFRVRTSAQGVELWKSDLTPAGTGIVKDIYTGFSSSNPDRFTLFGGQLYFTAMDLGAGVELWRTDGTSAGTVRVVDIYAGAQNSTPSYLTVFKGKLYFNATTSAAGSELWSSDGSAGGTVMVKDINPGSLSSVPRNLTDMGDGMMLFEAGDSGTSSYELWRTDGTASGTRLVKRIGAINAGSNPQRFSNVDGRLFFRAESVSTGVWTSDGTERGTIVAGNIEPTSGSSPLAMGQIGDWMVLSAWTSPLGQELWRMPTGLAWLSPDGVLVVTGTHQADQLSLSSAGGNITVARAGQTPVTLALGSINSIVVSGLGNDDVLDVTTSLGRPISFNGNGGHNTLRFLGGSNTLTSDAGAGSDILDVTIGEQAQLTFASRQQFASLSVAGVATLATGGTNILNVTELSIAAGGLLDARDNDLVINYSSVSPVGTWNWGAYDQITGMIADGRIASSSTDGSGFTLLGVGEANQVLGISGSQTALFGGEIVDASSVLVKYTYGGDVNLSGNVDVDDYGQLDFNASTGGLLKGFFNGDLDLNGIFDVDDYGIIDFVIGIQGPPL